MSTNSRKALEEAQDDLKAAQNKLAHAHEATEKAQAFVMDAEKEVKRHTDVAKGATLAQALAIRETIKSGRAPVIKTLPSSRRTSPQS